MCEVGHDGIPGFAHTCGFALISCPRPMLANAEENDQIGDGRFSGRLKAVGEPGIAELDHLCHPMLTTGQPAWLCRPR